MQASRWTQVREITARARQAGEELRELDRATKDKVLTALADTLIQRRTEILDANGADLHVDRDPSRDPDRGPGPDTERRRAGAPPDLDARKLTRQRLEDLAYGLLTTAAVPDPIGEVVRSRRQRNGVQMHQVRVPIGVVAVLHEGQPATVVRAAGLLIKTGNALVLQDCLGGAGRSNSTLVRIVREVLQTHGVPPDAVQLVPGGRRSEIKASVRHLLTSGGEVDLLVPLLSRGVPPQLRAEANVPVVQIGAGNCHVYVDAAADQELAMRVVLDSKVGHESRSRAAEKVLVHADIAERFVPTLHARLREHGVTLHADRRIAALAPGSIPVTEQDWRREYRSPDLVVAVVDSLAEATAHIARYGTGHTEAVVTGDAAVARAFTARVDAATVTVNAPTTFAHAAVNPIDPELGYSTQRLHPRGPLNLAEFTTTKWVAWPARHEFTPLAVPPEHAAHHDRPAPIPAPRPQPPASRGPRPPASRGSRPTESGT